MASIGMPYPAEINVGKNSIKVALYVELDESDDYEERFVDIELLNYNATMSYTKSPNNNNAKYYEIEATIRDFPKGVKFSPEFQLIYEYREYTIDRYGVETVEDSGEFAYYYNSKRDGREGYKELQQADYVQEVYPTRQEFNNQDTSSWVGINWDTVISYQDVYLYTEGSWNRWTEDTVDLEAFNVYTHPDIFHFKNDGTSPSPGDRWNVTEGLKTLFPNFDEFNSVATAKKRWQNQSNSSACNAFPVTGNLSATDLNDAYAYLGINTNFQSGDIITASMFSDLEDAINN